MQTGWPVVILRYFKLDRDIYITKVVLEQTYAFQQLIEVVQGNLMI